MANLLQDKAERICQAWQRCAPRKHWAGLSLESFCARVAEPLGPERGIHAYAARAELILEVLAAIENDPEAGRASTIFLAIIGPRPAGRDSHPSQLAA
jgi:hypothetical protein